MTPEGERGRTRCTHRSKTAEILSPVLRWRKHQFGRHLIPLRSKKGSERTTWKATSNRFTNHLPIANLLDVPRTGSLLDQGRIRNDERVHGVVVRIVKRTRRVHVHLRKKERVVQEEPRKKKTARERTRRLTSADFPWTSSGTTEDEKGSMELQSCIWWSETKGGKMSFRQGNERTNSKRAHLDIRLRREDLRNRSEIGRAQLPGIL
jgi:hypothetical protein